MFAPKWARGPHNLARFPSWDPCITPGYWAWYLNVLPTSGSLFRSLFYAFMPREGIYTCVFCPPSSPQRRKPGYAALLRIRGNYFRPYLSIPRVCHGGAAINENSPTSERRTGRGNNSIILKKYIMPLCFSRITYLSFGTESARETRRKRQSLQPCNFLTYNNARWPIDRFYIGYIVFAGQGHQKIIEVMMPIKITGESVKFMGSKSI